MAGSVIRAHQHVAGAHTGGAVANIFVSDSHFVVYADRQGQTLTCEFRRGARIAEEIEEQYKTAESHLLHVALVSLCFTHCKGATLTDHQQPRQQRRAAEREGRPPLVTFRTINIAPVSRVLHEQGQIENVRGLHVSAVPGHDLCDFLRRRRILAQLVKY